MQFGSFVDTQKTWFYYSSDNVTLTQTPTSANGLPSLSITIDALSAATYSIRFVAPDADPNEVYPPSASAGYPGLKENLSITVKNDTGGTIPRFAVDVTDLIPLTSPDVSNVTGHPDNYSHFHNVRSDLFNNGTTVALGPGSTPTSGGPANQGTIAPDRLVFSGLLASGASVTGTGLTLHAELVPPDGRANNSFDMTFTLGADDTLVNSFAIASVSASKPPAATGSTPYTFVVTRSGDTRQATTLNYSVAGSGAHPYVGPATRGTIAFSSGDVAEQLTIGITADSVATANETFTVTLSGPDGVHLGVAAATGTVMYGTGAVVPVAAPSSTISVYRFFDKSLGTHFFTGSTIERDGIIASRPDLSYEGVGLNSIDPSSSDPSIAPVFRFFDKVYGTHFFTASVSEKDSLVANRPDLSFEGTGFYEHLVQQTGDTAVYRFFDTRNGTHFYTADATERAGVIATRADLKDEGIGFYAPSS